MKNKTLVIIVALFFIGSFVCGYSRVIPITSQGITATGPGLSDASTSPAKPKYIRGDLIEHGTGTEELDEEVNPDLIRIILDYDPKTDEYQFTLYRRNTGEIVEKYNKWDKRSSVEVVFPVKSGHIELPRNINLSKTNPSAP